MMMFLSFLARKTQMLMFMLLLAISLLAVPSHMIAYATSSPLNFSMQPLISNPLNPATRAYFVLDSRPNAHVQNSIVFTNIGTTSGTLVLYPVDAFTAPEGGAAFYKENDPRKDVGSWITLSTHHITLRPGQTLAVPFQVHIPSHVRSGQHIGGIAAEDQTVQTIGLKGPFHLHLQQRHVIAVQVNLPGTPLEKLDVLGLHPDNANHYQRLQVNLKNTGNVMLRPTGALFVSDLQGHRLQRQKLHIFAFLPQTSITYSTYIQRTALPIGRYQASLMLTYGHHHTLFYTTIFTMKAQKKTFSNAVSTLVTFGGSQDALALLTPWQLAIAGFVLLLILGTLSFWLYKACLLLTRSRNRREQTTNTTEVVHSHVTTDHSLARKDRDDLPEQHPH